MARLEEITKDAVVRGILPNAFVTIISSTWHGTDVLPHEIYNQVEKWLSLDQHWHSIDKFCYKRSDGSDLRISELFIAAKRNTADLRGIRPADLDGTLFPQINDLHNAVRFVVAQIIRSGPAVSAPEWLNEIGKTLQRILLDDKGVQARIRQHAAQYTTSQWQPISSLQVTPYLDNVPVGQPQRPSVLWSSSSLFVRDVNIVESRCRFASWDGG